MLLCLCFKSGFYIIFSIYIINGWNIKYLDKLFKYFAIFFGTNLDKNSINFVIWAMT